MKQITIGTILELDEPLTSVYLKQNDIPLAQLLRQRAKLEGVDYSLYKKTLCPVQVIYLSHICYGKRKNKTTELAICSLEFRIRKLRFHEKLSSMLENRIKIVGEYNVSELLTCNSSEVRSKIARYMRNRKDSLSK